MTKSKKAAAAEISEVETAVAPRIEAKIPRDGSKLAGVVALLERDNGATLPDLMQLTGWQEHSVRGVLAGALKRRFGLTIISEKTGDIRVYRASRPAA